MSPSTAVPAVARAPRVRSAARGPRARRSATSSVREELSHVRAGRPCDRRAELAGLLRSAGTFSVLGEGRYALEATNEHAAVARRAYEALIEALGARGEVRLLEPGKGHPRQRYAVRAEGVSLQRLVEAGILDDYGAPSASISRRLVSKSCCAAAYLRGAFLARGSVSDPRAPAHFEIRASAEQAAEDLAALMRRSGVAARAREHRGIYAAYCKGSAGIGTLLVAMGAHDAYLTWEAGAVFKSVNVEAGRLANADAANARRLARAAVRHLAAIETLEQTRGLASLPRALREMADLRRAHPDASLDELAQLSDPPISKAASADRLRRLCIAAGS